MTREEMERRMHDAAVLLEPIAEMKNASSEAQRKMVLGCKQMVHALTVGAFAVGCGLWDDEVTSPSIEDTTSETRS